MSTNKLVVLQPSPQQLLDYANALITINNYAWAITNQDLPILSSPPSDYGSFATDFTAAKQHALDWSANIFVELVQFPTTIVDQAANLFNMEDTFINAWLQKLIADPGDANAKQQLKKALDTVRALISQQVTSVTTAQEQLAAFGTNIAADAKILTQISARALADADDDQKNKITSLLAEIDNLNNAIDAANRLLTLSEIGMGGSLFVGLIGVACCFVPGAQTVGVCLIIVGVAGEAASIAGTVIEKREIAAFQAEIDADQTQIAGLKQDIILLKGVSKSFDSLYNANLQAQNALTTIGNMWTSLGQTITEMQNDLTDVENDNSAEQYTRALSDFGKAEEAWGAVVAFAQALAGVNISWQDASGAWHNYGDQSPGIDGGKVTNVPSKIKAAA